MKPVLLKIKGLNSFLEEQTIDFEDLTKYGFFGIFGPTGSGKSTIIDAITLALYGEVSRYDGDSRNKEFVNTNTDSACIYFEFKINKKNYVVERSFKLKNGSIKSNIVRLYIKNQDEDKILEDKKTKVDEKIKEILGLSYNDFTRTVVLPQGKFSKFLLLTNKERRNMLERIFGLEKFGQKLSDKIRESLNEYQAIINNINSNLDIYGKITEDDIKNNKEKIKFEKENVMLLEKKIKSLTDDLTSLKQVKNNVDELEEFNAKKIKLDNEKERIKDLEIKLDFAKKAELIYPLIEKYDDISKNILDKKKKYDDNKILLNEISILEKNKEIEYNNILNRTVNELPNLKQELTYLKQVMSHLENKQKYEIQLNSLREELVLSKNNIKTYESKISRKNEIKIESRKTLNNLRLEKEEIYIPPERRENISKGYRLFTDIEQLKVEAFKHNNRIENTEKELLEDENTLKTLNYNLESLSENKNQLDKSLESLQIISEQEMLTLNKDIMLKENILTQNKTINDEVIFLNEEIKNSKVDFLKQTCDELKSKLSDIENKIDFNNKSFESYEKEKSIVILIKTLKENEPCPVCGSLEHKIVKLDFDEKTIEVLLTNKKYLENQKTLILDELNKNTIKYELENNIIKDLKYKLEKNIAKLKNYNIAENQNNINNLKEQFLKLQNEYKTKKVLKQETEQKLNKFNEKINKLSVEIASIGTKIKISKTKLGELKKDFDEKNNLIYEKTIEINELKKFLDIDDFVYFNKKIKEQDKRLNEINLSENKLNKIIEDSDDEINKLNFEKEKELKKSAEVAETGIELQAQIKQLNDLIKDLTLEQNPKSRVKIIEETIYYIEATEIKLKNELNKIIKDKENIIENSTSLNAQIYTLDIELSKQDLVVKEKLQKYNFKERDEVKNYILENSKEFEEEVEQYKNQLKFIIDTISNINKKLKDKDIKDIEIKIEDNKNNLQTSNRQLIEKREFTAVLIDNTNKMEEDLKKINELLLKKEDNQNKLDLLKDLAELLKGNSFVEFIAKKQLSYITKEASVRLKSITKGRYAIELDETDFIIRDDFNGGIRRSPRTLSGGETFIASLCLALALSSKIQLNNKNPLEFFFLDEGFGTLDKKSLDDVIECLLNLRLEKLIIGIISHSDDLKERVPIKLMVNPSVQFEKGTTVKIEN